MRLGVLVAVLAAVPLLAGCAQTGNPSSSDSGQATVLDPALYKVPPIPKADAAKLLADHHAFVQTYPNRQGNTPDHEAARNALLAMFNSFGLETYRFNFTKGIPQADIVGVKWGLDRNHWVFVGGHYDIVNTPSCSAVPVPIPGSNCVIQTQGAYDDASGTFLTQHLARLYGALNATPYYTIAFTAYDGEERGLQGASAIVAAIQEGNLTIGGVSDITLVGDLDIDMVGINWPGTMAPVNVITNTKKGTELVQARAKELGFPDDQILAKDNVQGGSSDYAAFWHVKTPAPVPTIFLISDFNELGAPAPAPNNAVTPTTSQGLYPFWHREDTIATMTAAAGGDANLQAGFQAAADLTAGIVHFLAYEPTVQLDAVAR